MRVRDVLREESTLRSWARRLTYGTRLRPDVQVAKLERRVEVLERLQRLNESTVGWMGEFTEYLTPYQPRGMSWKRIGSRYDGGYVLPVELLDNCDGVVSIGVGHNNEADVEIASRCVPVHAWDHTVDRLPMSHPLVAFHKVGLGVSQVNLLTLDAIVKESFPSPSSRLHLLLDAEGAEWEALATCQQETLSRFSVIAAELHCLGDLLVDPRPQLRVLERMHSQFVPVVLHANNYSACWDVAGVSIPDALEVTWVNRTLVDSERLVIGNCPQNLLAPCCPDLPEIKLTWLTSA